MVSRVRLAIVGMALLVIGGFVIGYASGANSVVSQVTSTISSAVGSIPLFGSTLANAVNSYVQAQLTSNYEVYYDAGIVLILLGLVGVGFGMRRPRVSAGKAAPARSQVFTAPSGVAPSQKASRVCKHCGASLGAATTFCPSCGRSVA